MFIAIDVGHFPSHFSNFRINLYFEKDPSADLSVSKLKKISQVTFAVGSRRISPQNKQKSN